MKSKEMKSYRMFKKNKSKDQKGWSKNWSGRGTATINWFEDKASTKEVIWNCAPSIYRMLRTLIKKFPSNKFYLSLLQQKKNSPFSALQKQCIKDDFRKKILHFK